MKWPSSRRLPADTAVPPPGPQGNLAVAPLIGDKRCYGEVPLRSRWGNGEIGGLELGLGLDTSRSFRLPGDDLDEGDFPGLRL